MIEIMQRGFIPDNFPKSAAQHHLSDGDTQRERLEPGTQQRRTLKRI